MSKACPERISITILKRTQPLEHFHVKVAASGAKGVAFHARDVDEALQKSMFELSLIRAADDGEPEPSEVERHG